MKLDSTESDHVTCTIPTALMNKFKTRLIADGCVKKKTGQPDVSQGLRQLIAIYVRSDVTE
jgi:hypothetical protein